MTSSVRCLVNTLRSNSVWREGSAFMMLFALEGHSDGCVVGPPACDGSGSKAECLQR